MIDNLNPKAKMPCGFGLLVGNDAEDVVEGESKEERNVTVGPAWKTMKETTPVPGQRKRT